MKINELLETNKLTDRIASLVHAVRWHVNARHPMAGDSEGSTVKSFETSAESIAALLKDDLPPSWGRKVEKELEPHLVTFSLLWLKAIQRNFMREKEPGRNTIVQYNDKSVEYFRLWIKTLRKYWKWPELDHIEKSIKAIGSRLHEESPPPKPKKPRKPKPILTPIQLLRKLATAPHGLSIAAMAKAIGKMHPNELEHHEKELQPILVKALLTRLKDLVTKLDDPDLGRIWDMTRKLRMYFAWPELDQIIKSLRSHEYIRNRERYKALGEDADAEEAVVNTISRLAKENQNMLSSDFDSRASLMYDHLHKVNPEFLKKRTEQFKDLLLPFTLRWFKEITADKHGWYQMANRTKEIVVDIALWIKQLHKLGFEWPELAHIDKSLRGMAPKLR